MDPQIAATIERLEAVIQSADDALAIPRESAEFVYTLLRATGARRGLEIGTSYGYSALWAGAAIAERGGRLITIDRDPRKHEIASTWFAEAGLDRVIECRTGVAGEVLDELEGPFDYVLNDADKENCGPYVKQLLAKLAPRAVVLTDNTLTHQEELGPFISWVRDHPSFASAHVPVGNGFEMSVYVGG